MVFADESRFTVAFNGGKIRVLRRPEEYLHDATVEQHDCYGGGSVVVWGGFRKQHRTPQHRAEVSASPDARDFFFANVYLPGPVPVIFSKNLLRIFRVLAVANADSCVGLQNKPGHPTHRHN